MYKYIIILFYLFILSCDTTIVSPDPNDCNGQSGGSAFLDDCNNCVGGQTGLNENYAIDCNGECDGTATEDNCGICDDNQSNDCTADCNGDFGGTALEDNCGVCDGDNSTCLDCEGTPNGSAYADQCGTCDTEASNDCTQDCTGTWGGSAETDECGICGGDDSSCSGCTDSTACNYDNSATLDDGTCIPSNECSLCEECDLSVGTIYLTNDSELWYNVTETINGFQFDIYGVTITGISDGDAQNSGFEVTYTNGSTFSRVIGYSTSGSTVAPGCGTLLNIIFDGTVTNVSDIVFGTTFGEQMNIDYTVCP